MPIFLRDFAGFLQPSDHKRLALFNCSGPTDRSNLRRGNKYSFWLETGVAGNSDKLMIGSPGAVSVHAPRRLPAPNA